MSKPETWPMPPVEGELTVGEPSRKKPKERGEKSLYDENGGEWRPHLVDKYHDKPHWNYKPSGKNSEWQDVDPVLVMPEIKTYPRKPAKNKKEYRQQMKQYKKDMKDYKKKKKQYDKDMDAFIGNPTG